MKVENPCSDRVQRLHGEAHDLLALFVGIVTYTLLQNNCYLSASQLKTSIRVLLLNAHISLVH